MIEAVVDRARQVTSDVELITFEEPETHGAEPPQNVADAMKDFDVVVAPTTKSLTHTDARREACDHGARVATLPMMNQKIWSQALSADMQEVKRNSEAVYRALQNTAEVRVTTPSGTDVSFEVDIKYYKPGTGMFQEPGDSGNLPAGETFGVPVNMSGTLVIDHFPIAPSGTTVEIEDDKVVSAESPGNDGSELEARFGDTQGARNMAEFGFGTNPEAELVGTTLQDEKVLGTVHFAFGDNSSYVPGDDDPREVNAPIHQDTVCEKPTVYFDDTVMLDSGKPVFLDRI
jgi:Leucyl aminopeptidase (aminopeptidase T)